MKAIKLFSTFILLSILSLSFVSCQSEEEIKSDLVGYWEYYDVYEYCGIYFDYTGEYQIEKDQMTSDYEYYDYGTYTIDNKKIIFRSLEYRGQVRESSFKLKDNVLTLDGKEYRRSYL